MRSSKRPETIRNLLGPMLVKAMIAWQGRSDYSPEPEQTGRGFRPDAGARYGGLRWSARLRKALPSKKRRDAKYCSAACTQKAYRRRREAAAESVRDKTGTVVALIPNTAPPGAPGEAEADDGTKSAIDGVRDQGGTVVALIPNAGPPGAPTEPGECTKGIELPGETVPGRRWRVTNCVLECTAMGGWRQVLPGVPLTVALVSLGFSPDSATSLPVAIDPAGAQSDARWVDRWGFIHCSPAGSRVPLSLGSDADQTGNSETAPSVDLREAA